MNLIHYALPLFIVIIGLESSSLNMIGAISALLMAYIIILMQNISWFLILLIFFILGMIATKYMSEKKKRQKLIQKTRGSKNVMSNGGIAMLMAILGGPMGLYGFIGAISTATADTISSEVGVMSKKMPIMITTLKKAKPGKNGAISVTGTMWGVIGSLIIGIFSLLILPNIIIIPIAVISGLVGNFADSFFGAVFENRGHWGNSITNMLATATGAITAMILWLII